MICIASRHRPVSKKTKNPRDLPLPPLSIIRSPNSDLLGNSPPTRTSSATLPQLGPPRQLSLRHENPHSQTSLQKFRPLHVWLPAQAFSYTVPSSSPKTIKWSSLLNQFSGAAIRLPAPGAAIRLPVRPPSDRSQRYWARWCYAKMLCEIVKWKCRRKVLSEVAGRKNVVCKLLRNGM
jgi:hypothetical protein